MIVEIKNSIGLENKAKEIFQKVGQTYREGKRGENKKTSETNIHSRKRK